jgi:VanZ family protein
MGVIFVLSSQSSLPGIGFEWEDKLFHVAAYAGLGVLALGAFHGGVRHLALGATLAALAVTAAYGVADECHQSMVSGRVASIGDAVADGVGAVLAVPIYAWLVARRANPKEISAG